MRQDGGHDVYIFSERQAVYPLGEILQLSVIPVLLLLLLLQLSQQERPGGKQKETKVPFTCEKGDNAIDDLGTLNVSVSISY